MSLLAADEPAPFELYEPRSARRPVVFVCDHAANRLPRSLRGLGLDASRLTDHIAWDIGAAAVARGLAERFEARAVLAVYSRLAVDLNRDLRDGSAFPAASGGVLVPGNLGLGENAKAERARVLYAPYHAAVRDALDTAARGPGARAPVLIAVHSFTPTMHGVARPWHVGVLWDKDARLPVPLLAALRRQHGLVVGDNEPYSGRHPADYTIDHHAEPRGIAHASIEIRQDLVGTEAGQREWVERLAEALRPALEDDALYAAQMRSTPPVRAAAAPTHGERGPG